MCEVQMTQSEVTCDVQMTQCGQSFDSSNVQNNQPCAGLGLVQTCSNNSSFSLTGSQAQSSELGPLCDADIDPCADGGIEFDADMSETYG